MECRVKETRLFDELLVLGSSVLAHSHKRPAQVSMEKLLSNIQTQRNCTISDRIC
jgi:hypothetical protein